MECLGTKNARYFAFVGSSSPQVIRPDRLIGQARPNSESARGRSAKVTF